MTTEQIQHLLCYLGYDVGKVDGILGEKTARALRQFQSEAHLAVDGIPGELTYSALKTAVATDAFRKPGEKRGDYWDEIRYFRRDDAYIGCSCGVCGGFPVEPKEKLIRLADRVRSAAGRPMIPTSTVRCPAHNAAVGGVSNSRHLTGQAMDFYIPGMSAGEILALLGSQPDVNYCYAINATAVHMDVN